MSELTKLGGTTDAKALERAIRSAGERLARPGVAEDERRELARGAMAHLRHERSGVREAVAEAAQHFPDAAFQDAIGALLDDPHEFVKRAAKRSYDERARRARVVREQREQSAGARRLRAKLDDDHGTDALRLADRLCELTLSQFVDRLEHELRKVGTPLLAATFDVRAEAQRGAVDRARLAERAAEAHGIAELLFGIVAAARAHAEVTAPSFAEVSVRGLVEEQLALLRARIGPARAERLRADVDVASEIHVEADRVLLGQALSNVLQNAVEAYPEGGAGPVALHIAAEHPKAALHVTLVVTDHGRGMSEDWLRSVGEPFMSSKGRGRGLGVLNVKKMVETVHGGVVEIDSEVGRGTRVEMILPRKQAVPERGKRKRKAPARE